MVVASITELTDGRRNEAVVVMSLVDNNGIPFDIEVSFYDDVSVDNAIATAAEAFLVAQECCYAISSIYGHEKAHQYFDLVDLAEEWPIDEESILGLRLPVKDVKLFWYDQHGAKYFVEVTP